MINFKSTFQSIEKNVFQSADAPLWMKLLIADNGKLFIHMDVGREIEHMPKIYSVFFLNALFLKMNTFENNTGSTF